MVLTQVRSIVCGAGELGETVAMLIENQNPFAASLRRSTLHQTIQGGQFARAQPSLTFDPVRLTVGASAIR
jgi:hypothetical protein